MNKKEERHDENENSFENLYSHKALKSLGNDKPDSNTESKTESKTESSSDSEELNSEDRNENSIDLEDSLQIICYLDFDGTITNLAGRQLVGTPFYNVLQQGTCYPLSRFKEEKELITLLMEAKNNPQQFEQAKRTSVPRNFAPSDGAIRFLNYLCEKKANINIISKNHGPYIKALLKASEIKANIVLYNPEINLTREDQANGNIIVYDCTAGLGTKGEVVYKLERGISQAAKTIRIIADDDENDFGQMRTTISWRKGEKLLYCKQPGEFAWEGMIKDIEAAIEQLKPTQNSLQY